MEIEVDYEINMRIFPEDLLILADNTTMLYLSMYDILWTKKFTTNERYLEFCKKYTNSIANNLHCDLFAWELQLELCPKYWSTDEATFRNCVRHIKYLAKSYPYNKNAFFYYSHYVLSAANFFYKLGLEEAPMLAFLEVILVAKSVFPNGVFDAVVG
ncbi:hypothetical protein CDAR_254271 [Caerostris darwini]|uniref:Uncharacterized protein n=1 Tax=Caerostris darwini TaxID=1538125 RepID=A0AAV4RVR0_9ARAC|nr:hypothetical protein CDAR_254271 [Caerostris darwini]